MSYLDQAAAILPSNYMIMRFTPAQLRRIDEAANLWGWKEGESVLCARQLVLWKVREFLRTRPAEKQEVKI